MQQTKSPENNTLGHKYHNQSGDTTVKNLLPETCPNYYVKNVMQVHASLMYRKDDASQKHSRSIKPSNFPNLPKHAYIWLYQQLPSQAKESIQKWNWFLAIMVMCMQVKFLFSLVGASNLCTKNLRYVISTSMGLLRLMHTELHWLDVPERVQHKLGVLMYRCQHNQAPRHLTDYCTPISDTVFRQRLRSASSHQVSVPRYRLSTYGRRAFSVAGPTVWNSLPEDMRDPEHSVDSYSQSLKTIFAVLVCSVH